MEALDYVMIVFGLLFVIFIVWKFISMHDAVDSGESTGGSGGGTGGEGSSEGDSKDDVDPENTKITH